MENLKVKLINDLKARAEKLIENKLLTSSEYVEFFIDPDLSLEDIKNLDFTLTMLENENTRIANVFAAAINIINCM